MRVFQTPSNLLDNSAAQEFLPSHVIKNKILKQIQNDEITGWNSSSSPTQFGGDNDYFNNNNNISDQQIERYEDRYQGNNNNPIYNNLTNAGNSRQSVIIDQSSAQIENSIKKYPIQTNALKELSNNLQINLQQKKNNRYQGTNYDQIMLKFTQQPLPSQQKGKRKSQQFSSISTYQNNGLINNTNLPNISTQNEDFSSIVDELKQLKEFLTSPIPQDSQNVKIQNQCFESSNLIGTRIDGRTNSVDSQERDQSDNLTKSEFKVRRFRINSFQQNTIQSQKQNLLNLSNENLKFRKSQYIAHSIQQKNQSNDEQILQTAKDQFQIAQYNNFSNANGNVINLSALTGQAGNTGLANQNNYSFYINQKKSFVNKANSFEGRRKRGKTIDLLPKISEMQRYQNTIKTSRITTQKTNETSQKSRIGQTKTGVNDCSAEIQKMQVCKTSEDRKGSQVTINQIKKLMNQERIYYKENLQQIEQLKCPQSKNSSQNNTKQNTFFLKNTCDSNNYTQTYQSNHTICDQQTTKTNGQVIKIQNQNNINQQGLFDDSQFTQESQYNNAQQSNMHLNQFNSKFQISLAEYLKQNATQRQQFFTSQKKAMQDAQKKDPLDFNKNVRILSEKYSLNNILQHQESPRLKPRIPINASVKINNSKQNSIFNSYAAEPIEKSRQNSSCQKTQQSNTLESKQALIQAYSPFPNITVQQSQQVVIQKGNNIYSPSNEKNENEHQVKYTQFNSRIPKKLKDLLEEQYVRDSKLREIQLVQNNVM
ncbi:hypothetical protein TTHERM_00470510 (macronuclear) [Tetrahymena thermophila SB210]|uniref:Uncharacterized protein n=1 Tax=Tetrahymena thermophila (strain SB210) TaxID=312017 RepID=I7LTH9_TETTS|nr:hypothetical protein TTHERM_00470510 [Tetrahymena thermophila SB210]EAR85278.1 hypothetical protein TTHERM_00470510 [Tetrahymena thermophila SB210]|eukprot:XP_001032941.1 hypothetical protein TTHERM_00470510 [Tetrahymena thermophila SB210]